MTDITIICKDIEEERYYNGIKLQLGGEYGGVFNVDGKEVQIGRVSWKNKIWSNEEYDHQICIMDKMDLNATVANSFYDYVIKKFLAMDRVKGLTAKKDAPARCGYDIATYIGGIKLYEHLDETAYQLDEPAGGRVGYEITFDKRLGELDFKYNDLCNKLIYRSSQTDALLPK